jgi:hypothetical protein
MSNDKTPALEDPQTETEVQQALRYAADHHPTTDPRILTLAGEVKRCRAIIAEFLATGSPTRRYVVGASDETETVRRLIAYWRDRDFSSLTMEKQGYSTLVSLLNRLVTSAETAETEANARLVSSAWPELLLARVENLEANLQGLDAEVGMVRETLAKQRNSLVQGLENVAAELPYLAARG